MGKKQILLVEDNPDDIELTLRAFKKSNIINDVVVMHDGVEAIEYLADSSRELPQVVLLDLKMPRMDGIEVLKRIRGDERTRLLPVVVLTSSKDDKDIVESYSLGANSYVQKPVSFAEFLEAARRLGMYWLLLNQGPPCSR
jgi:CheY-like chemotaxis protein